jgi:hypothetical protein
MPLSLLSFLHHGWKLHFHTSFISAHFFKVPKLELEHCDQRDRNDAVRISLVLIYRASDMRPYMEPISVFFLHMPCFFKLKVPHSNQVQLKVSNTIPKGHYHILSSSNSCRLPEIGLLGKICSKFLCSRVPGPRQSQSHVTVTLAAHTHTDGWTISRSSRRAGEGLPGCKTPLINRNQLPILFLQQPAPPL